MLVPQPLAGETTIMSEVLVEPFAAPEIYVEGFTDYEVKDGVLTCAGYRTKRTNGEPFKEVVLRIVMPVANLADTIAQATTAAREMRFDVPVLRVLS